MPERALIIVPTYNEAVNLPHIVPQALAQDPRLEVLVVDDNSPDGTGRMADEMARTNPRVYALHREDLPETDDPSAALADGFGAEPGDRVLEISLPRGGKAVPVRAWTVAGMSAAAAGR